MTSLLTKIPRKSVSSMTVDELRLNGYAVVVFNPTELSGADPVTIQDLMTERGWNAIETLKEQNEIST